VDCHLGVVTWQLLIGALNLACYSKAHVSALVIPCAASIAAAVPAPALAVMQRQVALLLPGCCPVLLPAAAGRRGADGTRPNMTVAVRLNTL
jgi:hypothetical protein